ncbi:MAG: hypothetical protein LBV72_00495 [Tannerella sp.]|jgi:hypothetical protein|nr:hypothetical protein [Tannerella sp.]
MKVLSVKQPWAYLLCARIKPIENRTWKLPEKYKGERVLIHASGSGGSKFNINLTDDQMEAAFRSISEECLLNTMSFGAIIGSVVFTDCVQNHTSIWAEKDCYNWVVEDVELFEKPILNVKGKLSFWDYPSVKGRCPEFQAFGARYPDARCIAGYLWDMDSDDGNGNFTIVGDVPCPFCNTNEWLENEWFLHGGITVESGIEYINQLIDMFGKKIQ